MDVEYFLSGDVNNSRVKAHGKGTLDPDTGDYAIDLVFTDIPMQWDPAFSFLMTDTNGNSSPQRVGKAQSMLSIEDKGYIVSWRGAYIYDDVGRHVGHITASSKTSFSENKLTMHSEIHHGYTNLLLDEQVIEIETPYKGLVMPTEMADLVTFAYKFRTDKGNRYWGWTTYPYISNSGRRFDAPHEIIVEKVSLARSRQSDGNEVLNYSRRSQISRLV